jgi:hypothetical protein
MLLRDRRGKPKAIPVRYFPIAQKRFQLENFSIQRNLRSRPDRSERGVGSFTLERLIFSNSF